MLQNFQCPTQRSKKPVTSAMKHKIRNLRARLKNLLSTQACCKLNKRQKTVRKMQQNEIIQNINKPKQLWTFSREKKKQLFWSEKIHKNCNHVFSSLQDDQIQQLKEDIMYYMGQDNAIKFQQFLKNRVVKKQTNYAFKKLSHVQTEYNNSKSRKTFINDQSKIHITLPRDSLNKQDLFKYRYSIAQNDITISENHKQQLNQQNNINKRIKTCTDEITDKRIKVCFYQNLNASIKECVNQKTNKRINTCVEEQEQKQNISLQKKQHYYLGNRHNFLLNRTRLQHQQKMSLIMTKQSILLKQQKAHNLLSNSKSIFSNLIQTKNKETEQKTKKIMYTNTKLNNQFGEIVQLNQELRQVIVRNISKRQSKSKRRRSTICQEQSQIDSNKTTKHDIQQLNAIQTYNQLKFSHNN